MNQIVAEMSELKDELDSLLIFDDVVSFDVVCAQLWVQILTDLIVHSARTEKADVFAAA